VQNCTNRGLRDCKGEKGRNKKITIMKNYVAEYEGKKKGT
jgi:hypothetical protein